MYSLNIKNGYRVTKLEDFLKIKSIVFSKEEKETYTTFTFFTSEDEFQLIRGFCLVHRIVRLKGKK